MPPNGFARRAARSTKRWQHNGDRFSEPRPPRPSTAPEPDGHRLGAPAGVGTRISALGALGSSEESDAPDRQYSGRNTWLSAKSAPRMVDTRRVRAPSCFAMGTRPASGNIRIDL